MRQRAQKRVGIWLPAFSESKGGIQSFSQELVRVVVDNEKLGQIDILIKNDRGVTDVLLGNSAIHARVFGRWPDGSIRTVIFALNLFLSALWHRPELIIVGHANFARFAVLVRRILGIPFWVALHGVEVWEENGKRVGKYLEHAERLLAVSRFTRDKVAREQGLALSRFSLLPNTVDATRFRPRPKAVGLLQKLRIPYGAKIILTVCRLSREESYKGYDRILEALPKVKASVPETHFVLVGEGNDTDRVRHLVSENRLDECVTLAGYVSEKELVDCYNLCDIFAMPSRQEGFGIVFLEALACGKSVLAGNCDGSSDALCDGELGPLVCPDDIAGLADALIALLNRTHPHPIAFNPEELRRRTLDHFGRAQFRRRLDKYLAESLSST